MHTLITDMIAYIAMLALIGYFAYTVYTVTMGLYRLASFKDKLWQLGFRFISFLGWLSILIIYFMPGHIFVAFIALFAGFMSLSVVAAVLFIIAFIPIFIVIGKLTKMSLKNGDIKMYPPRYLEDNDYYYFIKKSGKESIKKEDVEKIEQVRYISEISGMIKQYIKIYQAFGNKEKVMILDILILRFGYILISVIITFVILSFLI